MCFAPIGVGGFSRILPILLLKAFFLRLKMKSIFNVTFILIFINQRNVHGALV